MLNTTRSKILQQTLKSSKIYSNSKTYKFLLASSKKNFSGLAQFDYTDPLKMEDLLTEEEKMVKFKKLF